MNLSNSYDVFYALVVLIDLQQSALPYVTSGNRFSPNDRNLMTLSFTHIEKYTEMLQFKQNCIHITSVQLSLHIRNWGKWINIFSCKTYSQRHQITFFLFYQALGDMVPNASTAAANFNGSRAISAKPHGR